MSVQVEKLEKSMVKLTIEVDKEEFDRALNKAYLKKRGRISLPGFRKGKAPRAMIEQMYGEGFFYEDAANLIIPDAYEDALGQENVPVVARPEIEVEQIEKGKPFIFTATVAVKPEITVTDYKGVEIEKKTVEVTEEEITEKLDADREENSRMILVEDRPTKEGDTVLIDFDGTVDGEPFEGGKAENYSLTLGSNTFIDTFEDQLVGKNIGDKVDVNVTFPDQYQAEELRNKPAVFHVKIHEIREKELPELDDDFAQDVSDCDTLEEYKETIKEKLLTEKEAAAKRQKEEDVINRIIEKTEMEIPDQMVESQTRGIISDFSQRLQMQGLSMEQYMQMTGQTQEALMDETKPQALKQIQSRLVLEAVVAAENIQASEEEIEKEIENMAPMYQMEPEKFKEMLGKEDRDKIAEDLAVQKAVDFLVESAVEK